MVATRSSDPLGLGEVFAEVTARRKDVSRTGERAAAKKEQSARANKDFEQYWRQLQDRRRVAGLDTLAAALASLRKRKKKSASNVPPTSASTSSTGQGRTGNGERKVEQTSSSSSSAVEPRSAVSGSTSTLLQSASLLDIAVQKANTVPTAVENTPVPKRPLTSATVEAKTKVALPKAPVRRPLPVSSRKLSTPGREAIKEAALRHQIDRSIVAAQRENEMRRSAAMDERSVAGHVSSSSSGGSSSSSHSHATAASSADSQMITEACRRAEHDRLQQEVREAKAKHSELMRQRQATMLSTRQSEALKEKSTVAEMLPTEKEAKEDTCELLKQHPTAVAPAVQPLETDGEQLPKRLRRTAVKSAPPQPPEDLQAPLVENAIPPPRQARYVSRYAPRAASGAEVEHPSPGVVNVHSSASSSEAVIRELLRLDDMYQGGEEDVAALCKEAEAIAEAMPASDPRIAEMRRLCKDVQEERLIPRSKCSARVGALRGAQGETKQRMGNVIELDSDDNEEIEDIAQHKKEAETARKAQGEEREPERRRKQTEEIARKQEKKKEAERGQEQLEKPVRRAQDAEVWNDDRIQEWYAETVSLIHQSGDGRARLSCFVERWTAAVGHLPIVRQEDLKQSFVAELDLYSAPPESDDEGFESISTTSDENSPPEDRGELNNPKGKRQRRDYEQTPPSQTPQESDRENCDEDVKDADEEPVRNDLSVHNTLPAAKNHPQPEITPMPVSGRSSTDIVAEKIDEGAKQQSSTSTKASPTHTPPLPVLEQSNDEMRTLLAQCFGIATTSEEAFATTEKNIETREEGCFAPSRNELQEKSKGMGGNSSSSVLPAVVPPTMFSSGASPNVVFLPPPAPLPAVAVSGTHVSQESSAPNLPAMAPPSAVTIPGHSKQSVELRPPAVENPAPVSAMQVTSVPAPVPPIPAQSAAQQLQPNGNQLLADIRLRISNEDRAGVRAVVDAATKAGVEFEINIQHMLKQWLGEMPFQAQSESTAEVQTPLELHWSSTAPEIKPPESAMPYASVSEMQAKQPGSLLPQSMHPEPAGAPGGLPPQSTPPVLAVPFAVMGSLVKQLGSLPPQSIPPMSAIPYAASAGGQTKQPDCLSLQSMPSTIPPASVFPPMSVLSPMQHSVQSTAASSATMVCPNTALPIPTLDTTDPSNSTPLSHTEPSLPLSIVSNATSTAREHPEGKAVEGSNLKVAILRANSVIRSCRYKSEETEDAPAPQSIKFDCGMDEAHADFVVGVYNIACDQSLIRGHKRPVYMRTCCRGLGMVFVYYWDRGPGKPGWWIGPEIGGDFACAFSPSMSRLPPVDGWFVVDPACGRDKLLEGAGFCEARR